GGGEAGRELTGWREPRPPLTLPERPGRSDPSPSPPRDPMRPPSPMARPAVALAALLLAAPAGAQTRGFEEYAPRSTLVVPETRVTRARFPFIDVHNHQRELSPERVDGLVRDMDALNMAVMVNLSGG